MTRTCLFCGITFLAANPARQYCSAECRKNAAEARVTERRMLADGRSRSGSENARAIAEINRRARAAGLSYGKYLA